VVLTRLRFIRTASEYADLTGRSQSLKLCCDIKKRRVGVLRAVLRMMELIFLYIVNRLMFITDRESNIYIYIYSSGNLTRSHVAENEQYILKKHSK
jgi:hypothetical protein